MTSADEWARRAASFGQAAADYHRGRPGYPEAAAAWAIGTDDAGHPAVPRVLDLAAGTGKLTETLLALGCEVVAVEPLEQMRAFLPPAATALAGTAEDIPLADASVDAVTVAQAFHWFDAARATAEIARVLRPGGRCAALWNMYDAGDPLSAAFAATTKALSSSDEGLQSGPPWPPDAGIVEPELRRFHETEEYDADRLVAYASSHSWLIYAGVAERERVLTEVRRLAPAGRFRIVEQVTVWRGRRG